MYEKDTVKEVLIHYSCTVHEVLSSSEVKKKKQAYFDKEENKKKEKCSQKKVLRKNKCCKYGYLENLLKFSHRVFVPLLFPTTDNISSWECMCVLPPFIDTPELS